MSLQQNRRVSFSDMNRSLTVTNGNTGIGTTAPSHMLDVNGGVRSINFTTSNALITDVTTGTLNASTGITAASAQITNINATTETVGTSIITTSLRAIGNSNTLGNIFTTGGSVGIGTTSPATDNGSRLSIVGSAFDGSAGIIRLYPSSYGDKACIGFLSGQSTGSYWTLGRQNISNEFALSLSTNTAGMYFFQNGNVSCGPLTTTALTTGSVVATTSISSGAVNATNSTMTNFVATTSSAGTAVATTYTGGSMSLSGNLAIGGTLTTVNITTTNISETNVSAGTVSATNIGVTTQTVGTSRITTSLLALGNSNTVGNIFTTGGNVGIGTGSPALPLHISNSTGNTIRLQNASSTSNACLELQNDNSTSFIGLGSSAYGGTFQNNLFLQSPKSTLFNVNGNTTAIFINTSGNVGIGTVSPGYTLDVNGTGRFTGKLTITGNAGLTGFDTATNDQYADMRVIRNSTSSLDKDMYIQLGAGATSTLHLFSNNTETMTLKSGLVGIGSVSPRSNLEITQTSSTTGVMLYSGLNDGGVNSIFFHHSDRSQGDYRKVAIQTQALGSGLGARANLGLCVNTANDNTNVTMSDAKLFISGSTGNIGIGTTAPSGMLHLNGSALFTSTGNLTCTGDIISFGSLSDRRLKKNIEAIDKNVALDVVSRLRGVTFDWREDIFNESKRNTGDIGFIAQEIEELVPEAVSEYTEINSGEVYKSIKYERLIPYLLVTIQHLLDKV